ncbi:hypothetical protein HK18_07650 [Commensalibacter intestini]|uniref:Lipoprotein n=2 Tax=Commensalibacter intestini TaxID=479936 RepID=A0A251ZVP1_9PROT|nr:hypothetical protein HK18_07650 [Commensalibacter intestini]
MIKNFVKISCLILVSYSLLGCGGTFDIGINKQDFLGDKAIMSFYVQTNSNLLIKNTDIIYISTPTFSCKYNVNTASSACPKTKQILEKIKPDIEKKFIDLGYHITKTSNQANLFVSLDINLYIQNFTDYIPNTSAFDKNPLTKLIAIQNGYYCGTNPVTQKEAYQILNDPQRSNCHSSPVNAYEYNYHYTLSIFEKNNSSTPIYQSKIEPMRIDNFTIYGLINKMIDANFTTFPMKGNGEVIFLTAYPKLEPVNIRY